MVGFQIPTALNFQLKLKIFFLSDTIHDAGRSSTDFTPSSKTRVTFPRTSPARERLATARFVVDSMTWHNFVPANSKYSYDPNTGLFHYSNVGNKSGSWWVFKPWYEYQHYYWIQWSSKFWTSLIFKWLKHVPLLNGSEQKLSTWSHENIWINAHHRVLYYLAYSNIQH